MLTTVCLDLLSLVNSLHTLFKILIFRTWQYCDELTSLLGSGQRVIAYSLYVPWNANNQSQSSDGEPTDSYTPRYLELMEELAVSVARMYPGWRMRQCCNEYSDSNLFF